MSEENNHQTVGEIAGLTGVSVRTLHHYDHIGLVVPSERSWSGYRLYTDADVERLHRVLVYREVGFSLEQIATLLDDPDGDELSQLEDQRKLLAERIDRLHRMVAALEELMTSKNNGVSLTAAEQAEIFGDDWPNEGYAAEAQERWGDTEQWRQSKERTAKMSKADWQAVKDEQDALFADLASAKTGGVAPGSETANELAERHRASIARFYDCSHSMQVCLGQMYVADERFTKTYDDHAPGLAQWVHDIIVANAAGYDD
ncbi:putative MerR family transcriptional regulator [Gordonia araii NBRC 100433]|uniref:Putative MerR family transcriptional regulator n=1 Tax=Gordonia araii NBRC 100433 TaxID=1073574 RepID=G7GXJ4_9ACTN|nr:MerR family transcriptional regulator [Gordonia araii]GAB08319.1 putative MerR family transcriptional regulator [Gordonia araii NBRC 100433]